MVDDEQLLLDDPALRCWLIDSSDFPAGGSVEDALRFCIRYAVLAPSGHNTQPWWFRVDGTSVTVGLDLTRGLAVLDPHDREALMSVGAAVLTLRVALARFGFPVRVSSPPVADADRPCVRLDVSGTAPADVALSDLFDVITRRRTSRTAFDGRPVPDAVLLALSADVRAEGAELTVASGAQRHAVAALVGEGDRLQMADKRFRRELAMWLRPAHSRRPDGMRWHGSALVELLSVATPLVVRTFDVGDGQAARDEKLTSGSPVLAVLSTADEDQPAWLAAGQALARFLLRAAANDVQVGYLNQPVEVESLRPRLADALAVRGHPQLLVRLGYGQAAPPQPRRLLEDVLRQA